MFITLRPGQFTKDMPEAVIPDLSDPSFLPTLRESMEFMAKPGSPPLNVRESTVNVPARDGHQLQCVLHQPASIVIPGPLIVAIHGGGFMIGNPYMLNTMCRNLVERLGATCVNIRYRLAPEHPFPAAVNDAYDVLNWVCALVGLCTTVKGTNGHDLTQGLQKGYNNRCRP